MPFKKGQSGNPRGRPPKEFALSNVLRRELDAIDESGLTNAERVSRVLIELALAGNIRAIEIILDRIEGKVEDKLIADNTNITKIIVEYADEDNPYQIAQTPQHTITDNSREEKI